MSEETQMDRIERTMNERFDQVDKQFDALHREMDGRFKSLWQGVNKKFDEQNAHLRSQDKKTEAVFELLAENEDDKNKVIRLRDRMEN